MEDAKITFKCDECDRQLNQESPYPHSYGLVLSCMDFNSNRTGIEYAVQLSPVLDRDYHFCNVTCLGKWVGNFKVKDIELKIGLSKMFPKKDD